MSTARLVRMANQIGAFFEAMPDADQGVAGVAEHLRKFWEPRMRAELAAYVAAHGDGELKPVVRAALKAAAVARHRD
ncbi:MAG: formate dehydrogenase subunit delta [Rhodocyclales bacterium]|nr:formate dehydrogenase subunit delta [Rhodocyclales bacterium]MBI5785578.1 formate dehydrogenase subunit delta [Rhodocyclales bacterium]